MPTIGMQMPKLFLRGSFVNKTIKNLTQEQQDEVADLIEQIKDDPLLQPTRYQFRNALKYTIKGDYNDEDAADQEYIVALWKAVVAAKHGWGEHEASEETITNKFQRKKFFQTWVFNYLRQILNENKRSFINNTSMVAKPTFEAAKFEIMDLLSNDCKIIDDNNEICSIKSNLYLLSIKKIQELLEYRSKYINKNIKIEIEDDQINIKNSGSGGYEMVEVTTPTLVNVSSTSKTVEEGGINEPVALPMLSEFNDPDAIEMMFDNLSELAQEVFRIIINPPEGYVAKYGEKPIKRYIQEYLYLSPKQVKDIWSEMKVTYIAVIAG